MSRVEFTHHDDRYRLERFGDVVTMARWDGGDWREIARLTLAAANVLADLDGHLDIRPPRAPRPRRRP